jgi:hypothetical protein
VPPFAHQQNENNSIKTSSYHRIILQFKLNKIKKKVLRIVLGTEHSVNIFLFVFIIAIFFLVSFVSIPLKKP